VKAACLVRDAGGGSESNPDGLYPSMLHGFREVLTDALRRRTLCPHCPVRTGVVVVGAGRLRELLGPGTERSPLAGLDFITAHG
jgi:hypothetical protein